MTAHELARHLLPGWKEERGNDGVHVFTHRSPRDQLYHALAVRADDTLEQVRYDCAYILSVVRTGKTPSGKEPL